MANPWQTSHRGIDSGNDGENDLNQGLGFFGEETRDFIHMIWKAYRPLRTIQLSAMAHQKGSPWYKTVTEALGTEDTSLDFLRRALPIGLVIEQETIREYFGGMVRAERDRAGREAT